MDAACNGIMQSHFENVGGCPCLLNTSLKVSAHVQSASKMPPGDFCTFKPGEMTIEALLSQSACERQKITTKWQTIPLSVHVVMKKNSNSFKWLTVV